MSNPKEPHLGEDLFEEELEGATVLRLRGEDPRSRRWQPEDSDLLQFVRNPRSMAPELRNQISAYLETHPAERDALSAFEQLAPAAAPAAARASWFARAGQWVSNTLESVGGAQRALAAAASLTLIAGVGVLLTPNEEEVWRGQKPPVDVEGPDVTRPPIELGGEIELVPSVSMPIESSSLPRTGEIVFTMILPGKAPVGPLQIQLVQDGAAAPLAQASEAASDGSEPTVQLRVNAADLEPGSYRIEVSEPGSTGLPVEFLFDIR